MPFKVRNGSRLFSWQDVSCGESSLKAQFPSLFRMTRSMDAMLHGMISWKGNQIHWNLSLLRSPNDWQEESACNLLAKLANMEVAPQGNDVIVWHFGLRARMVLQYQRLS